MKQLILNIFCFERIVMIGLNPANIVRNKCVILRQNNVSAKNEHLETTASSCPNILRLHLIHNMYMYTYTWP